jgi:hypothetical protein
MAVSAKKVARPAIFKKRGRKPAPGQNASTKTKLVDPGAKRASGKKTAMIRTVKSPYKKSSRPGVEVVASKLRTVLPPWFWGL